jgi:hypothetical protein
MNAIPLHLQRRFEQRWAAKLGSLVPSAASKSIGFKPAVKALPRTAKAKEPAVLKQRAYPSARSPPACGAGAEGEKQMIKPKRSAEQQVADEADRRARHPLATRQTIADSQAAPEFQENLKRLRADRLVREAALKAKGK